MNKVPYPKHIQTFANQISILKQRGLTISNEQETEKWLRKVSYYRMSGYWYPLLEEDNPRNYIVWYNVYPLSES